MAPSMSLGVRPASLIASRADSDAIMRSERSGCWPATTPSPMIAYCPDDGCLGTVLVPPYLYKFMTVLLLSHSSQSVVLAKAGPITTGLSRGCGVWVPAFAGTTGGESVGTTDGKLWDDRWRVIMRSSSFVRSSSKSTAHLILAPRAT